MEWEHYHHYLAYNKNGGYIKMKVGIKEFTGAINKVQALVSEEPKKATGIMLRVADGSLDVCYNDGRKALIEKVNNVETVETDHFGNTVVDYESLLRAV